MEEEDAQATGGDAQADAVPRYTDKAADVAGNSGDAAVVVGAMDAAGDLDQSAASADAVADTPGPDDAAEATDDANSAGAVDSAADATPVDDGSGSPVADAALACSSDCSDDNPCTADSCAAGVCQHKKVGGADCDDGNACTYNELCSNGACVGGLMLTCSDGEDCTSDGCDPASGCLHQPMDGPCDDGDQCNGADLCAGGACVGGDAIDCDDANPCTTDLCMPTVGCVHKSSPGACEDGDPCSSGDQCVAGACLSGGPTICGDGSACAPGSCNASVGCLIDLGTCDDYNPCTIDSCVPSGCLHVFAPKVCSALSVPFKDTFECAELGWALSPALVGVGGTTTAVWAIDATPSTPAAVSGPCSLNFNDGVGSAGHNRGHAILSGALDGTGKTKLSLTLQSWFDGRTETGVDVRVVEASADGFATAPVSVVLDNTAGQQLWQAEVVDLKPLAGKQFQVRLRFDNVTAQPKPGYIGWFVDDLAITAE
ncbi:MAG: hypothetical protein HY902_03765 [Deltaproteobacteria bacterium]|nr:hypothetical protein [Deltaproteobacteria bacterium]